jgi:hypothetical protein
MTNGPGIWPRAGWADELIAVEGDSVIERPYYTIIKLSDPPPERPPFLVEGIVHSTVTLLYGEAKSGKSTLAAALAVDLANGAPEFLGRTITGPRPKKIGIIAGDFGDGNEYKRQLCRVTNSDAITIYDIKRPPMRQLWEDLRLDVRQAGHDLVIVDNLTSLIPGSTNDDVAVNQLYDQLDAFVREGAAVLLVAHTSEKYGEHGKSRNPIGHSAIRARARRLWLIEKRASNLKLSFSGNSDSESEIVTTLAKGTPKFDVLDTSGADELTARRARRRRTASTRDRSGQIADFVVTECQGTNRNDTADLLAARFGGEASTHRGQLSRGAYDGVKQGASGVWEQRPATL